MARTILGVVGLAVIACCISCTSIKMSQPGSGATYVAKIYYVDKLSPAASDSNPGTQARPWKSLMRAGTAKELRPGDTVYINSGIYRESMKINVSGERGRPITFAAAPGAKVVIKGSESIKGPWTKVSPARGVEPYPNAFQNIWKVKLGEEFFTDPIDPNAFADRAKRKVVQVLLEDVKPLLPVGPDSKVAVGDGNWVVVEPVGKGLEDLRTGTYFFDPATSELYTRVGGEPGWYTVEVSVRTAVLQIEKAHDLIVRGLEFRHSRGNLAGMALCQRVLIEDCQFTLADFGNFGMGNCTDCTLRRCDLSWSGNNGLGLSNTLDCTIEDCTIMFNNYRQYGAGWHDGGMKNIPGNKRTTIRRCEVAYNYSGGIWFDMLNVDTRILDNVVHHNVGSAIGLEVNYGPGIIAGNFCYANQTDAICVVGHPSKELMRKVLQGQAGDGNERKYVPENLKDWIELPDYRLWIVYNTCIENGNGIMTSHDEGTTQFGQTRQLRDVIVMNNLLVRNGQPASEDPIGKYVDLRFWMHLDKDGQRADRSCHSDYNVFAATPKPMLKPNYHYDWGKNRTLAEWQQLYGEDLHSQIVPVEYRSTRAGARLTPNAGLDCAGPLPKSVTDIWKPVNPRRVGANMSSWPK